MQGFDQCVEKDDKDKLSLNYISIHTAKIACLETQIDELVKEINELKKYQ